MDKDFLKLPLYTAPELQTDLCLAVLQLKALGVDNLMRSEFPSSPPSANLISALELLHALGALTPGVASPPPWVKMSETCGCTLASLGASRRWLAS